MVFFPPAALAAISSPSPRLLSAARRCGLAGSSLKFCVDPRDFRSYSGGQTLSDISGNGNHFNLGASASATVSDPTFTGTLGTLASYFAHDGGDYFSLASSNPAEVEACHKANAAFTIAAWWRIGSTAAASRLAGTTSTSSGSATGFRWSIVDADTMGFLVHNNANVCNQMLDFTTPFPTSAWALYSLSVDEAAGAGGLIIGCNDEFVTGDATYTSPSTGTATAELQLGASNGQAPVPNGSRFGGAWLWGEPLSSSDLTDLLDASLAGFS